MIGRTNTGGGGTGLNFKVVGNPQPESAKENTIWVDTDAEITGWVFSATEPEAPSEGIVWFSTGTSSTAGFNSLKKNVLMVYPMNAYQYINGAWAYKPAQIYQGGSWVDWRTWLLSSGKMVLASSEYKNGGTSYSIEPGLDNVLFTAYRNGGQYAIGLCCYVTDEPVDLTNINKITAKVNCESVGSSGSNLACATIHVSTDPQQISQTRVAFLEYTNAGEGFMELDVSAISGSYYIVYGALAYVATSGSVTSKVRVYDVYME